MDVFWILIAFCSGVLARLVRLPALVGFLAAGMLLHGFGATSGPLLEELGDIGVALLLFTVGVDLNMRSFARAEVLGAGGLNMVLMTLVATSAAMFLGVGFAGALLLGVALSVSSIILAAKTLEERDELGSYHGRVAIGILLLQTLVIGVVLAFVGGDEPSPLALGLVLLIAFRPVLGFILARLDSRELVLLFGLLMAMGGAYLFELAGLSGELGALAAGMLLAGKEEVERLSEKLWSLKEVFLAAFFLRVGLAGYPQASDMILVLALVGFLLLKGGMHFGLLALFRLKARTAFIASVALTSFSGITLIVGVLAVEAGLLPQKIVSVLAAATAISYVINAVATRYSLPIWRRVASLLSIAEREGRHLETMPTTLGNSEYLIIGMGRAGTAAYDQLHHRKCCVTGVDVDPSALSDLRASGRRVVYGDGRDKALWKRLDLSKIRAIVLGVPGSRSKIEITKTLRECGYEGMITAISADTVERAALMHAGASVVHLARDQAGRALADHVAAFEEPGPETESVGLDVRLEAQAG